MVQQEKDKLLHLYTRHTNLSIPYSDYVGYDKFPEQNKDMLGKIITIKYYNIDHYKDTYNEKEDTNKDDIYTADCIVLRFDIVEPYRLITISRDGCYIFISDSRKYDTVVAQYPVQMSEYIGVKVKDQYAGVLKEIDAVTLRVDDGEPCYSVIMEYIGDKIRFVLGDECFSKLQNYIDGGSIDNPRSLTKVEIADIRKNLIGGKEIKWY